MIHTDIYSEESQLINTCKRRLCDGNIKDSITKLRLLCLSRGATGILSVARSFRIMDYDEKDVLGPKEFHKGLHNLGLDIHEDEIQEIFNAFDENGDGYINLTEFILKLRPPMPNNRMNIIDKVFDKMDRDADGVISVKDIRRVYSVKNHTKYRSGERSEDEILTEFLHVFEQRGIEDGRITKEEFVNYYAGVSAAIDNDTFFDLVLRRAYDI